jgi:hypothetical protein
MQRLERILICTTKNSIHSSQSPRTIYMSRQALSLLLFLSSFQVLPHLLPFLPVPCPERQVSIVPMDQILCARFAHTSRQSRLTPSLPTRTPARLLSVHRNLRGNMYSIWERDSGAGLSGRGSCMMMSGFFSYSQLRYALPFMRLSIKSWNRSGMWPGWKHAMFAASKCENDM